MTNMSVPYRGPDGMSAQLFAEVKQSFGASTLKLGYITDYPEAARASQTGGHFPDVHGITHAVDIKPGWPAGRLGGICCYVRSLSSKFPATC
ncbi:hypothetical protein [Kocuria rosea]|uniref:hypothetical protein n=1 Tax=Kocuria rosea TaxID=1275 RepID=UPI003017C8E3